MNSKIKLLVVGLGICVALFVAVVFDEGADGVVLSGVEPGLGPVDDVRKSGKVVERLSAEEAANNPSDPDPGETDLGQALQESRLSVEPIEADPDEVLPNEAAESESNRPGKGHKLVPAHAKSGQYFGGDLDVHEGRLIVAGSGSHGALAYIFEGGPNDLRQTAELGDRLNPGTFTTVALGEDFALVGQKSWSERYALGSVFVFELHPQGWLHTGELKPSGEEDNWSFGYDLAVDGELAAVGDPFAEATGAVYVFENWRQGWDAVRLSPETTAKDSNFGISVSLSGTTCLVGAPEEQSHAGAAYIFEGDGQGHWEQTARLTAPKASARRSFGSKVVVVEDVAVVAEPGHRRGTVEKLRESGAVYVFERHEKDWTLVASLQAEEPSELDSFGKSLALKEGALLVTSLKRAGDYSVGPIKEFSIDLFERKLGEWGRRNSILQRSDSFSQIANAIPIAWIGNRAALGLPTAQTEAVRSGSVVVIDLD